MTHVRKYIDWVTIKAVAFVYYMAGVLEKYDHILDLFTRNISRASILVGFIIIVIRLVKNIKNKGANGD